MFSLSENNSEKAKEKLELGQYEKVEKLLKEVMFNKDYKHQAYLTLGYLYEF